MVKPTKMSAKSSGKRNSFEKLLDGDLDLATAFWGYAIVGTGIVGFISGWLAETFSKWLMVPYILFAIVVISGLFQCAFNHNEKQEKKKQPKLWGYLVLVFCVVSVFGILDFIKELLF